MSSTRIVQPYRLLSRIIIIITIVILSVGTIALTLFPLAAPQSARADTLCVKPSGGDGCQATISDALAMALENDTIQVAAGIYTENVHISRTVTLQGGWSPDFTLRDTRNFSSTIRPADNTQSVVSIQGMFADPGAVVPTLDGFVISGGRADLGSNHGGGLRIVDSDALVISNTIRDNRAFLLGGGVWVQRGAPMLQGNQIMDNQSLGLGQEARGGGVQLENSGATLISNTIAANRAIGVSAYGGGVDIISGGSISVTLGGNSVLLNATDASTPQNGFGGGIAIAGASTGEVILTNNVMISNTASIDSGGVPETFGFGGAIAVTSGQVRLEGSSMFSNTAATGGGIFIGGDFEDCCNLTGQDNVVQANRAVQGGGIFVGGMIDDCCQFRGTNTLIQDNDANEGGGLFNDGQAARINGGLLISNTAAAGGGGIFISAGGSISLTNSAAVANIAGADGGAIRNSGNISITNTTVSGNEASGMGGGIANFNTADVVNATVSDNTSASGAGFFNASIVNMLNSLIALNIGDNCLGVMDSQGHNLEDGGTCALSHPTDMSNTLSNINPLGDNGGATPTHALAGDSPAVDAGDNASCAPTDQRGVPRPLDGDGDGLAVCDIGAFESQTPSTTAILSDAPDPSQAGEPFTVTFSVTATTGIPTGAVFVTASNSSLTCGATLVGGTGSCALSLSTPGTHTLTAAYTSDDGSFAPSSDTEIHVVIEASSHGVYLPVILKQ